MKQTKVDLMGEAAEIAARVLQLKREGNNYDAGLVLCVESEQLARRARVSYADAKQTVGFYLSVACD